MRGSLQNQKTSSPNTLLRQSLLYVDIGTFIYIFTYLHLYVTKISFVNSFKIGAYNFFILCMRKGDINIYRMVKVPCRLMHWVALFGPFLGPNLSKNGHLVNFLENGAYNFFNTLHEDRGYRYLSNGENRI